METRRVQIRAYNKVWKIENRIYAIQNIVLPVPVSPRELGYFALAAGLFHFLGVLLPLFSHIPGVLRYIMLPLLTTQFLLKKKLDGKLPLKYFAAWVRDLASGSRYIERFQRRSGGENASFRLRWVCSRGDRQEGGNEG